MKALSVLFVLLSTSAFAAKVGDQATFSGTISNGSASYPISLSMKVTAANADGTYAVETTTTVAGQSQTQSANRSNQEIGDEAQAATAVANCSALGGVAEAIQLSSGETIATCKVTSVENQVTTTTNIAAIPFLIARFVQAKSGMTTSLSLQSYARGQ